MFRKLILSAVLATGVVAGVTNTASAQPTDFHFWARYEVQVRHRGHWEVRATYCDHDDAQRAARRLERQGFEVRVERVR